MNLKYSIPTILFFVVLFFLARDCVEAIPVNNNVTHTNIYLFIECIYQDFILPGIKGPLKTGLDNIKEFYVVSLYDFLLFFL